MRCIPNLVEFSKIQTNINGKTVSHIPEATCGMTFQTALERQKMFEILLIGTEIKNCDLKISDRKILLIQNTDT